MSSAFTSWLTGTFDLVFFLSGLSISYLCLCYYIRCFQHCFSKNWLLTTQRESKKGPKGPQKVSQDIRTSYDVQVFIELILTQILFSNLMFNQLLVVMTGGAWQDDGDSKLYRTRVLTSIKDRGIEVYSLGVGPDTTASQMSDVASGRRYWFLPNSYDDLDNVKLRLLQSIQGSKYKMMMGKGAA